MLHQFPNVINVLFDLMILALGLTVTSGLLFGAHPRTLAIRARLMLPPRQWGRMEKGIFAGALPVGVGYVLSDISYYFNNGQGLFAVPGFPTNLGQDLGLVGLVLMVVGALFMLFSPRAALPGWYRRALDAHLADLAASNTPNPETPQ
jgi:hypothetical protein